jgi:hypothetical protein
MKNAKFSQSPVMSAIRVHFVPVSSNSKTGPIPVTYSERATCPLSCPHYRSDCYAEDYYTRMTWDKVPMRGGDWHDLIMNIQALPPGQLWRHNVAGDLPGENETVDPEALGYLVQANIGKRGFTYTHKHTPEALTWVRHANNWGFTVNLSADDAGHADILADTGAGPVVCIVPSDTPEKTQTPAGRDIVVCPAQTRPDVTCATCGLCQRQNRAVIVGFRAHGTRAKLTNEKARRVIPISKI